MFSVEMVFRAGYGSVLYAFTVCILSAFGRQMQVELCELKASQLYIVISVTVSAI